MRAAIAKPQLLGSPSARPAVTHIELNRRFVDADEKTRDTETLLAMSEAWGLNQSLGWEDLLKSERVVVLADAGSGKSWEMEAQMQRLRAAGSIAFFLPLQMLASEGLRDCLAMEPDEIAAFDEWHANASQPAWFFLDSVDELKLTTTTLDQALGRFVRDIGAARARVRIVLSCRPWDWRPLEDAETLLRRLPVSDPIKEEPPTGDEGFVAPVRALRTSKNTDETATAPPAFRTVAMLALSQRQISQFLEGMGVPSASELLEEIVRQEALPFARRPLDLRRIARSWEDRRSLGTRLQQHEDDVASALADRTNRLDASALPPAHAIEGVERLALAMVLTKTRALQDIDSINDPADAATLSPMLVLDTWEQQKVGALLRRAIFDPATFGRVQFHHRSVLEFLAARRLHKLRDAELSARELERLLFADTYGERTLIPSMRPIAAWLAIWRPEIAHEILQREPEVLILHGDPASLTLDTRRDLLHAFVTAYGPGGWRGLSTPHAEVRRLAHADLISDIRACWSEAPPNDEVRQFLLSLIEVGTFTDCIDIALSAACDPSLEVTTRQLGIRALHACRAQAELRAVADAMLAQPANWPDRLAIYSSGFLFPATLAASEIITLIARTPPRRSATGDFSWQLKDAVETIGVDTSMLSDLRDALANLIWEAREISTDRFNPRSGRAGLSGLLAIICRRQLEAGLSGLPLVRAALIAFKFNDRMSSARAEAGTLSSALSARRDLRQIATVEELSQAQAIEEDNSAWNLFFRAFCHQSLVRNHDSEDWAWVRVEAQRHVGAERGALVVLLSELWRLRGQQDGERQVILELAQDDAELLTLLDRRMNPAPLEESESERTFAREQKQRRRNERAREKRAEGSWLRWKREAEADPASKFTAAKVKNTLDNLVRWLEFSDGRSDIGASNWREVRRVLGDAIGDLFEAAMRAFWRQEAPPLRSDPATSPNAFYRSQTIALTALTIESATVGDWISHLDADAAARAADWGTLALNRFPEWYAELAMSHAEMVRRALLREIKSELGSHAATDHPHCLSAVAYGYDGLKRLMAPDLMDLLLAWPAAPEPEDAQARHAENLDRLLAILFRAGTLGSAADLCAARFTAEPTAAAALPYLRGAFSGGIGLGLQAMQSALEPMPPEDGRRYAIEWIANLFGRRGRESRYDPILTGDAEALTDLIRLAYRYVAIADDNHHDGSYTPNLRDDAESGRSTLIGTLMDMPGKDAHRALLVLADDPLLAHMADRLRLRARERAAEDSDLSQLSVAQFTAWERQQQWLPQTPVELFTTMLNRLDDIEQDVRHHPFSDRRLLAAITNEPELQPLVAKRISDAARGAYTVTREEEVADKKEPDFRLIGPAGAGKAAIEFKIGDSCSVRELEAALRDQLLGQYLRHEECSVGCLLVSYAGRKGFEHPETGATMSFEEVIAHLRELAATLEADDPRDIRLGVATLDLRAPLAR